MKLPFLPVNMKNQKVTRNYECYLELLDDKLKYVHDFDASHFVDPEDEMLGMEGPERIYSEVHTIKSRVTAIEKGITAHNQWHVTISIDARAADISIYFDMGNEDNMNGMFDEILKWWYSRG